MKIKTRIDEELNKASKTKELVIAEDTKMLVIHKQIKGPRANRGWIRVCEVGTWDGLDKGLLRLAEEIRGSGGIFDVLAEAITQQEKTWYGAPMIVEDGELVHEFAIAVETSKLTIW